MTKWTGPLAPPPSWLDPTMEITAAMEPPKMDRGTFVVRCVQALLNEGCNIDQAIGVAANTQNETGWGQFYHAFNLGGWKIWKFSAKNSDGTPRRWWRALGNKSSNDPQTCFYRAFTSPEEFFHEWLKTFVPKVNPASKPNGRYWKTGQQFWSGGDYFPEFVAAGYKGDVSQHNPAPSIAEHAQITKTLTVMWCQHLLLLTPDGAWGTKSKAACKLYQTSKGLPATGLLDPATLGVLLHSVGAMKTVALVTPLLALSPDPVPACFDPPPALLACFGPLP